MFQISGDKNIIKKLLDKASDISIEVDMEMTASAQIIANEAKRKVTDQSAGATGNLAKTINPDVREYHKKIVTASAFYAPFVEFGTGKKVSVPSGYEALAARFKKKVSRGDFKDFVQAILLWMRRVGLKGEPAGKKRKGRQAEADKAYAVNIARKILRNGLTPKPFLIPSFEAEKPKLVQRIKKIINT